MSTNTTKDTLNYSLHTLCLQSSIVFVVQLYLQRRRSSMFPSALSCSGVCVVSLWQQLASRYSVIARSTRSTSRRRLDLVSIQRVLLCGCVSMGLFNATVLFVNCDVLVCMLLTLTLRLAVESNALKASCASMQ